MAGLVAMISHEEKLEIVKRMDGNASGKKQPLDSFFFKFISTH